MIKQIRPSIGITAFVLSLSGAASAATFLFGSSFTYDEALRSWPEAVVVGDVSGDGRDDAVLATSDYADPMKAYRLFIYAQTMQGTLAAPIQLPYLGTVGTLQLRMQMADVNNDGIKDIVVGHDQGITVFIALGNMRFAVTKTELPGPLSSLAVADLDRDGNVDIVRQAYNDSALSVLIGDGTGAFRSIPGPLAHAAWHQSFEIGDVTGDGLLDLVFTNQISLTVYPGKGTGDFMTPREYAYPDEEPRGFSSVAITDMNHDGRSDVLTTTSGNPPNAKIWIYTQAVDGSLSQPQVWTTYDMPEALMIADLDRNGYQDLLMMHAGWYRLGIYFQGRQGFAPEIGAWVPYATHYNQDGLTTGDLDSDGCTDVAIADYNHGLLALHGKNCYEPWAMANHHDGDFDGDGIADILWHNTATGASVIWKSGNSATQIPMAKVTDTNWTIAGAGDFNGDGKSDVLWHHLVTGANTLWRSGDDKQSLKLAPVNLSWEVVGIGDFDGNGNDDILWRRKNSGANAIWEGGNQSNARSVTSVTDLSWKVAGVGDFDGNGKADILWRHIGDGRNALWRNADYDNNQAVATMPDLGWQVAGLGDFDNDAHADILWHHAFDGRSAIWYSANDATSRVLTRRTNSSWKVSGIGDFANDGHSDILWRNSLTGANTIWRDANSTTLKGVSAVTNMNWKIMR